MAKIKDIPKIKRPRERLLQQGANALSKSDLLAILLGSGIKGTNVQKLSQTIIEKFNKDFLDLSIDDLRTISGIGQVKAMQIISAIALVKRIYQEQNTDEFIVKNAQDVLTLTHNLKDKKKEYLVCLYLNSHNALIKKETISISLLNKSLLHPKEVFHSAIELRATSVILIHNHPTGDPKFSEQDELIVKKISEAGKIIGIPVIDFLITAKNEHYSFYEELKDDDNSDYIAEGFQAGLFDLLEIKSLNDEPEKPKFTFIDLFAGIGGFHLAASSLGGKCVFASEFDEKARQTYQENFLKHNPELFYSGNFAGDITQVKVKKIPRFDFLFAGFPCQPFSKGGYRKGFKDTRGTLFFEVAKIIKSHNPSYVLLENVQNLVTHDDGKTFETICNTLNELGYTLNISPLILSPDDFGIPAIRKRIFIPAIRKELVKQDKFMLDFSDLLLSVDSQGIYDIVDNGKVDKKFYISAYEEKVLKAWNEFYLGIDLKVIGFPIWADEFNLNYDIKELPKWKGDFVIKNRGLYQRNKNFIDKWLKKYDFLTWMKPTQRKMEWQAGSDIDNIYGGLIQFRPSGVRVKRPNKFSTLVAMNQPQIIGKYKRRLTPNETKKLQSFPSDFILHAQGNIALKQLGNSVNTEVVKKVIQKMINYAN
ncbi:RadC family protein [Bathymodiolus thermophilus thioautotrophic gill symbiont]|uniref:Cytosine-specific methyltransferase n=1 Tax=Bathymodiolus thermophilus thioautotrophic gill symbiont TaxID=2360 RepID=A0A8H8XBM5_9GAMM|nr:DNA repair protein RadC [Bathymodiolus thermophilus thioautotrophic gill symbiont]CAB5496362.1 DNA-cytosine methyltransferase (EC [Bathymodiolus thermophilus thioautotrophic gill symbiont]